jgi:hypothetical protein
MDPPSKPGGEKIGHKPLDLTLGPLRTLDLVPYGPQRIFAYRRSGPGYNTTANGLLDF